MEHGGVVRILQAVDVGRVRRDDAFGQQHLPHMADNRTAGYHLVGGDSQAAQFCIFQEGPRWQLEYNGIGCVPIGANAGGGMDIGAQDSAGLNSQHRGIKRRVKIHAGMMAVAAVFPERSRLAGLWNMPGGGVSQWPRFIQVLTQHFKMIVS